jgi:hypothetical protein
MWVCESACVSVTLGVYSYIAGKGESRFHRASGKRPNYSWWERTSHFLVQTFRGRPLLRVLGSRRDRHMTLHPDLQKLLLARSLLRHYPRLLLKVPEIDQRRPHRFAVPGLDTTMEESDIERPLGRPSKRRHGLKKDQKICMN